MTNKKEKVVLVGELGSQELNVKKLDDDNMFQELTGADMADIGVSSAVDVLKSLTKIEGWAGTMHNLRLTAATTGLTYFVYYNDAKNVYTDKAATIAAVQTAGDVLFSSAGAWAGGLAGAKAGMACGAGATICVPVFATVGALGGGYGTGIIYSHAKLINGQSISDTLGNILDNYTKKSGSQIKTNTLDIFYNPHIMPNFEQHIASNTKLQHSYNVQPILPFKPSPATITVAKGDTIWKIAKDSGVTQEELLATPGNEYLKEYKYKNAYGKESYKIQPWFEIHLPQTASYSKTGWKLPSNYGDNIATTSGYYDFLNPFISGKYNSIYDLEKNIIGPYRFFSESYLYNKKYMDILEHIRSTQYFAWKFSGYSTHNFDTETKYKEFKDSTQANKVKPFKLAEHYGAHIQYNSPVYSGRSFDHGKYEEGAKIVYGPNWVAVKSNFGELRFGGSGDLFRDMMGGHPAFGMRAWPVVIDVDGDGKAALVNLDKSTAFYDIDDSGYRKNISWVKADDGFLSIDTNDDGIISLAKELSFKLWDPNATTDLEGLKLAFDDNKDGVLDIKDSKFAKLLIWRDYNGNGISEEWELKPLSDYNINAILLDQTIETSASNNNSNILKTVKIRKNGKAVSGAFDVTLPYSDVGIYYEEDLDDITLHYSNNQKTKVIKGTIYDKGGIIINSNDIKFVIGEDVAEKITANNNGIMIDAMGGDDTIVGSKGNDWLKGGKGKDKLSGGPGHDILLIDAEDREEDIDGGEDYDVVMVATSSAVKLDLARSNIEAVYGNSGNDIFTAVNSTQGVLIDGSKGDDEIIGSDYDDTLVGGEGKDKIFAGKGNDNIFIDGDDDIAKIDAGEGNDSIFIYGNKPVYINADKVNAENIYGGIGNDYIYSTGRTNLILAGNDGDDTVNGGFGDDIIDGGKGNDKLKGFGGNNKYIFFAGSSHDVINDYNAGGTDSIHLLSSIKREDLYFVKKDDDLQIRFRNNENDSITILGRCRSGSQGIVNIVLNADTDSPNAVVLKESGDNSFRMDDGQSWVIFTLEGSDRIGGSNKDDYIDAGAGDDEVIGWLGDDIIAGGPGNDYLQGWGGNDTYLYRAGDGNDTILDEYREIEIQHGNERRTRTEYVHSQVDSHCFSTPRGFVHCEPIMGNVPYQVEYDVPFEKTIENIRNGGIDKLVFDQTIKMHNLAFSMEGADLIIKVIIPNYSDGEVRIKNWAVKENKIEHININNHTISLADDLNFINLNGSEHKSSDSKKSDIISAANSNKSSYIQGIHGSNIIKGSTKADTLIAYDEDNHLYGENGNDVLFSKAKKGETYLSRGEGVDTFVIYKKSLDLWI